jgi:UDP-N-acetylmuramoyl-tripeptide--D-alanyl-D-alanine ligase
MKKFLIADLAKIIEAHPMNRVSSIEHQVSSFTGVSIDSRTTKDGDCFFAICGENFDGHDYVFDAFAKGAVCAVVSKDIKSEKLILKVGDVVKALGDFALSYRQLCGFKVVAITGSVGKTTARHIIHHVLSQHYRVHQAPKNFNNNIGLPLTLLGADPEHQIVIAELGTNHPGEIAYLTRIAQPDIAVVTNVYPAHLEGFGDLKTITNEKLSIEEGLQKDGILLLNGDSELLRAYYESRVTSHESRVKTFGKSDDSGYLAQNIASNGFSSQFTIDSKEVYLPLSGPGNIENALAAWAVCSRFDLTIDDFARAVRTLKALPMRAELLQIGTLTVLNDCYNANPASMKNALDILAGLGSEKNSRLVFICGDMAELGNQSEQLHTELGAAVAEAKVQLLIAVGKLAEIAAEAAQKTANYDLQIECFKDTLSVCNSLQELIKDNDIILVKGSRIAKLEKVIEKLKEIIDLRLTVENRKSKIENRK